MSDEEYSRDHPWTETEALAEGQRGKAGFDVDFPEGKRKLDLLAYVQRWRGILPDEYDKIRYLAKAARRNQGLDLVKLHFSKENGHDHMIPDTDWKRALDDPLLVAFGQDTISMGSGKGRAEALEMSKSNPPMQPASRWGFGRRRRGEP